jgi:hypothetical protein
MTVRGSGDLAGDCPPSVDDVGSQPANSADVIPKGRFWVLASSDEEAGSETEDDGVASDRVFRYLCRSPSPDEARDLSESVSGLARRAERRLHRQCRQRQAALDLSSPPDKVCLLDRYPSSSGGVKSPSYRFRFPAIEPTFFTIPEDDLEGWTVVR